MANLSRRILGGGAAAGIVAGLVAVPVLATPTPAEGTVSPTAPTVSWSGGFTAPAVVTPTACDPAFCDVFALTVDLGGGTGDLAITATQTGTLDTPTIVVTDPEGEVVADEFGLGTANVAVEDVVAGTYTVEVRNGSPLPAAAYTAAATLEPGPPAVDPSTLPEDTVAFNRDPAEPVASATVPLRVVLVGFEPGTMTEEDVFAEIPDFQRVGSLFQYGGGVRSGDDGLPGGAATLVNGGRSYYDGEDPFLLPIEYQWDPELVYAPSAFTSGLFEHMVGASTTGDFADPLRRAYLEQYNALRGTPNRVAASGDPGTAVAPATPVRFVDGESTEDWIAANSPSLLGFEAGRDPGDAGYTVFVLNTWDAPEAEAAFEPDEYHVFRIDRTDPDRGEFDGIDWARTWGGRYRFMMVDLGAAPNPYESESWGNRGRSVLGSALRSPPIWEHRAGAPRVVDANALVDGLGGIERAVDPTDTLDDADLVAQVARTLNEAVNFRFFHAYLYEPRPGTGRFFLSDNIWHDGTTAYESDLDALYDQEAALNGLRTLTPYFEFDGDVVYQYLDEAVENPDYVLDQAALDQAKQDGDDVAGAPHVSMHTETMMDYIDGDPARFLRGGECATTVPTIQVVVPGHYAWALPVAAGIATNREGVPWGFLNSVNDVTKWNGADKDQSLVLAHPNVLFSGTFTYTTIHEASHYLGLAHPHDTIGASRNPDGTPRYYDGFSWAFNTTAAPTTYSHVETVYSILDQESIARGHLSYYLSWAFDALGEAGNQWIAAGHPTVGQLPARAAEVRAIALARAAEAQAWFADFQFVRATFAAQEAWRAAAEYRDLAFGLPGGTSQVERGTQQGTDAELEAAGCSTAEVSGEPTAAYDPGEAPTAGEVGALHVHAAVETAVGGSGATHVHAAGEALHAHPAGALPRTGGEGMPLAPMLLATALVLGAQARLLRRRRHEAR